jgi:hypothetical protein
MVRDKSNDEPADGPNPGTKQTEYLRAARATPSAIGTTVRGSICRANPSAYCSTDYNRFQFAQLFFRL